MVKPTNILFCGTGGQGVLSAAEICGWAAVYSGLHVKKSEVHGMAQRGGSVESHLRFGAEVFSPLIPAGQVDFLVPFHPDEEARLRYMLKPKGVDLIDALQRANQEIKDPRYLNVFLLGFLSARLDLGENRWIQAIEKVFKNKNIDENKRFFQLGRGGL